MKRSIIRKVEAQGQHLLRPQRALRFDHRFPLSNLFRATGRHERSQVEKFFIPIERGNSFPCNKVHRSCIKFITLTLSLCLGAIDKLFEKQTDRVLKFQDRKTTIGQDSYPFKHYERKGIEINLRNYKITKTFSLFMIKFRFIL